MSKKPKAMALSYELMHAKEINKVDASFKILQEALQAYRIGWDGLEGERLWEEAIQAQNRFDKAILASQNARKRRMGIFGDMT